MPKFVKFGEIMDCDIPVDFLWDPYLPVGCVTLLAAKGGTGKSGFMLWLAAKLAREQGIHTLYVDAEHTIRHMRERSISWGLEEVRDMLHIPVEYDEAGRPESCTPSQVDITAYAKDHNCRLIVFDSLTTIARSKDMEKRRDVAELLQEYRRVAVLTNASVVLLGHLNKPVAQANEILVDQISGSAGLVDLSRSVLLMYEDELFEGRKIISHVKSNFRPCGPNIRFYFSETGVSDLSFDEPSLRRTCIIQGTKAETYRQIAKDLADTNCTKKEIRTGVKAAGGSEIDATRTVQWLRDQGFNFAD